jgi:hypothetical protein
MFCVVAAGMPSNMLVAENRPTKMQLTPPVQTTKTSLGHSATVKARDSAYEVGYMQGWDNLLFEIFTSH